MQTGDVASSGPGRGTPIHLQAPAKINLFLRITGQRPDGYHTLQTLMQKVDLADHLVLTPVSRGISLSCPNSSLPENRDNLAWRAARLFFDTTGNRLQGPFRGIHIRLEKKIPVAAGLGGGSSDGAAVLRGMDQLWQTGLGPEGLAPLARQLGADVPFFVFSWPAARATGIGEILHPWLGLHDFLVLLVTPDVAVSTRWAYEKYALTAKEKNSNLHSSQKLFEQPEWWPPATGLDWLDNDLEPVTAARYPVVKEIKQEMLARGASGTMMSGSGPTVFGLFKKNRQEQAHRCLQALQQRFGQSFLVPPLLPEGEPETSCN